MTSEMVIQNEGLTKRFDNITAVGRPLNRYFPYWESSVGIPSRSLLGNSIILDSVQAFAGRR